MGLQTVVMGVQILNFSFLNQILLTLYFIWIQNRVT